MSREVRVGLVATIVAGIVAIVSPLGNPSQIGSLPFLALLALVLGALVFALFVPWARRAETTSQSNRPAKAGLILSIIGLLTVVASWSGLPVIFGSAGALLGQIGRERAQASGQGRLARAAFVIGIVAVVLSLIAVATDRIECVLGGPC
jgi:quinol-cytochrome oxidoreductase complex cytochrome b subunit